MTYGQVVAVPERDHECSPGWREGSECDMFPGTRYAISPTAYEFPKGTVWECTCGRTWVSQGPPGPHSPGFVTFRREHWWERRRRRLRSAP